MPRRHCSAHKCYRGTRFSWTSAATLNDAAAKNPYAVPVDVTTYQVTAFISNCSASGNITVTPIPYPVVNAGQDTIVCFETPAQLHATTDGTSFVWAPLVNLEGAQTLDPLASHTLPLHMCCMHSTLKVVTSPEKIPLP